MKRLFVLGVAILCAAAACLGDDAEEEKTFAEKSSEKAEQTAATFRKEIRAELKTLPGHDWAGEYYEGDGMGVNVSLLLAPKSGFLFEWHGCMGLYDRNYGTVSSDKGKVRLGFSLPNKRKGFQGIAQELVPVAWGKRKYLIPSNEIIRFCNRVNYGSEPRDDVHGIGLLRRGDEKIKVTGFPDLPAEFKPYLLEHPIEAEIISVKKHKTRPRSASFEFKDTPIVLNCGKKQGLLKGMELHVTSPGNVIESAKITKVEEERAEGIITQVGIDETGPQVGWKMSTRSRWRQ